MSEALLIFAEIITHLPKIKQTLGEKRWPDFANQIRTQAALFKGLSDKAALEEVANELYDLFLEDEIACDIITQPGVEVIKFPQPRSASELYLQTITNRFYMLCERIDEVAEQNNPAEYLEQITPDEVQSDPTTKETGPKENSRRYASERD